MAPADARGVFGHDIEIQHDEPRGERIRRRSLRVGDVPELAQMNDGPSIGRVVVPGMLMIAGVAMMVLRAVVMVGNGVSITVMVMRQRTSAAFLAMQLVDDAEVFEEDMGRGRHPGCQHDEHCDGSNPRHGF